MPRGHNIFFHLSNMHQTHARARKGSTTRLRHFLREMPSPSTTSRTQKGTSDNLSYSVSYPNIFRLRRALRHMSWPVFGVSYPLGLSWFSHIYRGHKFQLDPHFQLVSIEGSLAVYSKYASSKNMINKLRISQYRLSLNTPVFRNAILEKKWKKHLAYVVGSRRLQAVAPSCRGSPDISWPGVYSNFMLSSSIVPYGIIVIHGVTCCASHPKMCRLTFNVDYA